MSGRDYFHIWYQAQMAVTLFLLLVICGWEAYHGIPLVFRLIPIVLLVLLGLVLTTIDNVPGWLAKTNCFLQALLQPLWLVIVWGILTRTIIVRLQLQPRGVVSLMLIYYAIMFTPFASEIGGQMKSTIARVVALLWWFIAVVFSAPMAFPLKFAGSHLGAEVISNGAVGAIAFFLMVTTVMRAWHLSWPGLLPQFGQDVSWLVIIVLLLVDIWFTVWNAYGTPHSWASLLTSYHFSWKRPGLGMTMRAFEAAVAEETLCRFGFLGCILYGLRNINNRVVWASLISSFLFAVMHYSNLFAQNFTMTTLQVINAFALGLFFTVVYLYTGQLWLTMLMHFFLDWLSFTISGTTVMAGQPSAMDWVTLGVEVILFVGISIWMMFGNRRHVLDRHANKLIGQDQRFGYRLQFD